MLLVLALVTILTGSLLFVGAIPVGSGERSNETVSEKPPISEHGDWQGRRGIYLTSIVAARRDLLDGLADQAQKYGLNAIVIDVKDNSGIVAYDTQVPLARTIGAREVRLDLKTLVSDLKARGLYVIARQVVFYDPKLATYLKSRIAPWVYPSDPRVVSYNLAVAEEAASAGFDEVQFDYIRYPDDGKLQPVYQARYSAIANFVRQAHNRLHQKVNLSADVFGRTLWDWNLKRIDPIGQSLEDLMPYLDVISPMIYPSHYESRRYWDDPYGTIKLGLQNGLERDLKMRPFLQAFEMRLPAGMTEEQYILAQIRAARELGFGSYLFWNPEGNYSALWRALASD
ncbi:MAG: hypothetical protein A2Z21_07115 [Candidatus Fraserbacteria bacterium RBG_16_55_9]|uniref:DUF4015 domain-containing protein n=1 Tax=Fraserbacteria sp. (strain RBG_16_55_9) TaxID=1817864 RepID=A0A1F5USK3_FRAXR|nr:MAG: hypothetical protein A2Z21_07115 [Candidatus Fraserbacteria bacterium RBG_16_55_9]